jgi:phage gp37-like protein
MFIEHNNRSKGWYEGMETDLFPNSKANSSIHVEETAGINRVVVHGKQYMSWDVRDEESQSFAIVQLNRCGLATQEELARLFGLHVNTVQRHVGDFARGGLQGLVSQRRGPKDKWKITPEIRAQILYIALKEGILGYDAIKKRLSAWNEHISIPSIRQVLLENEIIAAMSLPAKDMQQGEISDSFFIGRPVREDPRNYCEGEEGGETSWNRSGKA